MSGLLIEDGNPFTPEQAGKLTKTTVAGGGPTYGGFLLQLQHNGSAASLADLKTHVETLTVKIVKRVPIGGGNVREETIKLYDAIPVSALLGFYAFHGFPLLDGYLPIFFMQPNFRAALSGKVAKHFDLGTADVKEVHVECKLSATVVNPAFTLSKLIRNVPPKPMGQLVAFEVSTFSAVAAAGTVQIDNLPVKDGTLLKGIHIDETALDEIRLKVNGTLRHKVVPAEQDYVMELQTNETGGKNPQVGWTHIDLAGNDYGALWDMARVNRFDVELDVNAAIGAYNVWLEKVVGQRVAPGNW